MPPKKKPALNLTEILQDPGKAIGKLLDDPAVLAKFPEVLAKLPPEAMAPLAEKLAAYLKIPTAEEVAAVMPQPASAEEIAVRLAPLMQSSSEGNGDVSVLVAAITKNQEQLRELAGIVKSIQDEQPVMIQKALSARFVAELEVFQKKTEEARLALAARADNGGPNNSAVPTSETQLSGYDRITLFIRALVTEVGPLALEGYKAYLGAKQGNLAELLMKSRLEGMVDGNRLRTGEITAEKVAQSTLDSIQAAKKAQ